MHSRYEKYTADEEKKESKSADKFMDSYEGLLEKVTDLTLVGQPSIDVPSRLHPWMNFSSFIGGECPSLAGKKHCESLFQSRQLPVCLCAEIGSGCSGKEQGTESNAVCRSQVCSHSKEHGILISAVTSRLFMKHTPCPDKEACMQTSKGSPPQRGPRCNGEAGQEGQESHRGGHC